MTRNVENDLQVYLDLFYFFNENSLPDFFLSTITIFTVKFTEPIFYIFKFIINRISNGSALFFVFFYTFSFYFICYLGVRKVIWNVSQEKSNLIFVFILLAFGSINFAETSHLMRQYLGASFLVLYVYKLHYARNYIFSLSVLLCLMHNSIIVPLIFLNLAYYVNFRVNLWSSRMAFIVVVISIFLTYLVNYLIALDYQDELFDIFKLTMLYDLFLFMICYYIVIVKRMKEKVPLLGTIFYFLLFYLMFLSFLSFSETIFLRFYLYIECFRFFVLLSIYYFYKPIFGNFNVKLILILLCVLIFSLRVLVAPWEYFSFELF